MKFIPLVIFLGLSISIRAQTFNKSYLDEKVKKLDTTFGFKETVYIINGVPYNNSNTIQIDYILQKNGLKYLIGIDVLKQASAILHSNKDVVVVVFAHKQNIKIKRELFKSVKKRFVDKYASFSQERAVDTKDPVLYIDNERIHYSEVKSKLISLRLKSLYYISNSNEAASTSLYGQNTRNGIVRIWTKTK